MASDLSKVYFHEAYIYSTKDCEIYQTRIFKDEDKFTTQNCNKKIQKFEESTSMKH